MSIREQDYRRRSVERPSVDSDGASASDMKNDGRFWRAPVLVEHGTLHRITRGSDPNVVGDGNFMGSPTL